MKPTKRTILLTLAQLALGLALILTIIPAALPTVMLISLMQSPASASASGFDTGSILLCLRDLALGACLVCAEMEALGIITRLKKAPAATEKNDASLKRIIIALVIAAALALLLGNAIFPYLLMLVSASNPLLERLLMPAVLLGVALIVHTVKKRLQSH